MSLIRALLLCLLTASLAALPARGQFAASAPASAFTIPQDHVLQIDAFQKLLKSDSKLAVFQVGSHVMFAQAHIPGSQFAGPGSQPEGIRLLQAGVAKLAKNQLIVLYCGCCPWNRCPNVGPAYAELARLGYTNVKVLYMAQNFGADWMSKGYAVEKGE